MITIIGREFSTETIKAIEELDNLGIDYVFEDIDFNEEALNFLKAHKIKGIPVIRKGFEFIISSDEALIKKFLDKDKLIKNT